ncbi:MAG TPA: hypothetical protein VGB97_03805 [Candidatus Paceibacterota bacterium]|jgi:hypothetical protein
MRYLKRVGKPTDLPATDRFVMRDWLGSLPNNADLPINFLSGNGGEDWANIVEEAAEPSAVCEYAIQKPCGYRHVLKDLRDMPHTSVRFGQVRAFLKLDRHQPGAKFHFFLGDYRGREPRWVLDAGLTSLLWHLTVDIYSPLDRRWIGANIIAPA